MTRRKSLSVVRTLQIRRLCQKNVKYLAIERRKEWPDAQRRPTTRKATLMNRTHRVMVLGGIVAASIGATSVAFGSGGGTSTPSVLVTMVPCRLMDTRPAPDNVGPRATPLAANSTYTADAWGTNGNCTIPASATAISANVTAVNGTSDSFLTLFPADVDRPLSSNLNWVPGAAPVPNKVDVKLSSSGKVSIYNWPATSTSSSTSSATTSRFRSAPAPRATGQGLHWPPGSPGSAGHTGRQGLRVSRASRH